MICGTGAMTETAKPAVAAGPWPCAIRVTPGQITVNDMVAAIYRQRGELLVQIIVAMALTLHIDERNRRDDVDGRVDRSQPHRDAELGDGSQADVHIVEGYGSESAGFGAQRIAANRQGRHHDLTLAVGFRIPRKPCVRAGNLQADRRKAPPLSSTGITAQGRGRCARLCPATPALQSERTPESARARTVCHPRRCNTTVQARPDRTMRASLSI